MLNRRQFFFTAAGAAFAVPAPAPKYDLIVKGGRVIDPSQKLNAIRDVAIAGGRIAAVKAILTGMQRTRSMHAASSSFRA